MAWLNRLRAWAAKPATKTDVVIWMVLVPLLLALLGGLFLVTLEVA